MRERRTDDGVELSPDERRADFLESLASAVARARGVCAAVQLNDAANLIADRRRTEYPESVWERFHAGREGAIGGGGGYERLREVGFAGRSWGSPGVPWRSWGRIVAELGAHGEG